MDEKQIARLCKKIIEHKLKEKKDAYTNGYEAYYNNLAGMVSSQGWQILELQKELAYVKRIFQIK